MFFRDIKPDQQIVTFLLNHGFNQMRANEMATKIAELGLSRDNFAEGFTHKEATLYFEILKMYECANNFYFQFEKLTNQNYVRDLSQEQIDNILETCFVHVIGLARNVEKMKELSVELSKSNSNFAFPLSSTGFKLKIWAINDICNFARYVEANCSDKHTDYLMLLEQDSYGNHIKGDGIDAYSREHIAEAKKQAEQKRRAEFITEENYEQVGMNLDELEEVFDSTAIKHLDENGKK